MSLFIFQMQAIFFYFKNTITFKGCLVFAAYQMRFHVVSCFQAHGANHEALCHYYYFQSSLTVLVSLH